MAILKIRYREMKQIKKYIFLNMKGGISVNAAVINKNAKLQRVPEACADTNWSRNTLMKVAAEANAIIRVGRTVRIDMPVLYKYIDTVYKAN